MTKHHSDTKEEVLKLIQNFLKKPPVIIWISGATIPYGLPSMENLKKCLTSETGKLDTEANLELLPSRVKIDEPQKKPKSATVNFWDEWKKNKQDKSLKEAIEDLRRQSKK